MLVPCNTYHATMNLGETTIAVGGQSADATGAGCPVDAMATAATKTSTLASAVSYVMPSKVRSPVTAYANLLTGDGVGGAPPHSPRHQVCEHSSTHSYAPLLQIG